LAIYFPEDDSEIESANREYASILSANKRMLNLSLLTSVEGISNSSVIQNDEDLDKALQDFIANILKAIDVEIRHLVNTKYEGIIVTPVDTDSSTEEGVHLLMSRKLGRKLKNIGDMHVL
jgi:hypothetical protein